MRVKCEECNTNFNLDESLLKSTGSKVRCSKCKHIFVVYPPEPEEAIMEAPVTDAEQDAGDAFKAPVDELEPDHDADVSEAEAAPGTSLLDETPAEEAEEEDLDLSDIEQMLETEEKQEAFEAPLESLSAEDTGSGDGEESLDLSDIEKILDEEDDSDELLEEKIDEDEDLVFDLDEELEMEAVEEQISPTTELDLGDLEKMFEPEDALEPDEDGETSQALDMDTEEEGLAVMEVAEESDTGEELAPEAEEETAAAEPEDSGETLGFDMEPPAEEDEIARMADEEEAPTIDIEIDEEEVSEAGETEAEPFDIEIDFDAEAPEAEVEELDLEGQIEIETPQLETKELEISAEDISGAADVDDSAETETSLSDALELVLEGQDEEPELEDVGGIPEEALEGEAGEEEDWEYPDDAVPEIPDEEEAYDEGMPDFEEGQGTEEDFEEDYEEVALEARSGAGVKKLFALLAVVLVIILLLAAFLFLHHKEIIHLPYLDQVQIPFLSSQRTSQVADTGNLNISYNVDDYRFLDSEKAGRLFLISGKVKNEYSMPRSFVLISGSLYTKGKTLADTATAYCGNVIADLELSQMTPAAIRTRLANRSGENNSNVNIKPGEERPFLIVFIDVPESLDEFTVAVVGSSAGDT